MIRELVVILIVTVCVQKSPAQERYFYKGRDFGSEALFNPITLCLNGGFDILSFDYNSRKIFKYNYYSNGKNVFRSLGNPFGQISRYGWGNFLSIELFPLSVKKSRVSWWPNYQLHLIGGGMSYAAISEWFEENKFPYPTLFSIATMAVYHLLNEVVEINGYTGDTVDPIADIYFFDPAGIILFSFDGVKEFFSRELNLADWSTQATITLPDYTLENGGQNFSIKWKLPFSDHLHLFYYFGMSGLGGLSYKYDDGSALSLCGGFRAKFIRRLVIDETWLQTEPDLRWTLGAFYDIDNSLMASILIKGGSYNIINLNIYPGIIRYKNFSPGIWLYVNRDLSLMGGFTTRWTPGIGIK